MKNTILLILVISMLWLFPQRVHASHLEGGEIIWECLPSGKYVFKLDLYSHCTGWAFRHGTTQTLSYQNGTIILHRDSSRFNAYGEGSISPIGLSGCQRSCISPAQVGAIQVLPFISDSITLAGTPPPSGWIFTWTECCRPGSIANITSPSSRSFTIRAKMYPYKGQNASNCFDSSPKFAELPAVLYCKNVPQLYNHGGIDPDFDSLVYSWDYPWDNFDTPVNFSAGYSFDNPLPDTSFHPMNVPMKMDAHTGEISFQNFSVQAGQQHATTVKVDSYRDGILIASIFRDMPFTGFYCAANTPPTASFNNRSAKGYIDTIYPGEFVDIPLLFEDADFDSTTMQLEMIAVAPGGQNFSLDFTDSINCPNSAFGPCATLSPAPVYDTVLKEHVLKGDGLVNANFQWQTDCSHLGNESAKMYNFIFRAKDAKCDMPAVIYPTLSLYLAPIAPRILHIGDTLFAADTADSYQWFFNDSLIPNSDTNKIIATANGKYSVQIVKYNCPSLKSHYNMTTVSLDEEKMFSDVKIYPNPSAGKFTIEANNLHGSTKILVTDYQGREVQSFYLGQRYGFKREIDLSGFPKGIYLIQISNQLQVKSRKIVLY